MKKLVGVGAIIAILAGSTVLAKVQKAAPAKKADATEKAATTKDAAPEKAPPAKEAKAEPAKDSAEALAAESTAWAEETAKDAAKLTPQMVIEKVEAAAALIEKEGEAAFAKMQGKGTPFIFGGTYIWVHDLQGVMLMHPIKHKMVGKALLHLKDSKGKLFFVEMNALVNKSGSGWVQYYWPKPGEKEAVVKSSYVKLVTHGDKSYVVGCGVYDWTSEQIEKALAAPKTK